MILLCIRISIFVVTDHQSCVCGKKHCASQCFKVRVMQMDIFLELYSNEEY